VIHVKDPGGSFILDLLPVLLVLACVPGGLGEWLYRLVVGVQQNEKQVYTAVRLIGFSVFGLCLYGITCVFGAPEPVYVFPRYLSALEPAGFPAVAAAFVGHCFGGAVAGFAAGEFTKRTAVLIPFVRSRRLGLLRKATRKRAMGGGWTRNRRSIRGYASKCGYIRNGNRSRHCAAGTCAIR
jgi:hypothetical protein